MAEVRNIFMFLSIMPCFGGVIGAMRPSEVLIPSTRGMILSKNSGLLLPQFAPQEACSKLHCLEQKGVVCEYVKEFPNSSSKFPT